jgi:chorismate mutase/prephenate dehydratase
MKPTTLPEARVRIDALDEQIQGLINERARVAEAIRDIKAKAGDIGDHYRPAREAEVLRKAMERNAGPISNETMAKLVREIMSACLALESPLTVAYLGPEGTYTQEAVYKHFGHAVEARAKRAIDEIFRDVDAGHTAYGVVPVENSIGGVVTNTLDELASATLTICGEVLLPVHHHLMAKVDRIDQIKVVFSHAQSLTQCRNWLHQSLPHATQAVVASNGAAAQQVAETGQGAAIASKAAAERYGLNVLASNIEDDPSNTTRFLIIGRKLSDPTGRDKTSLVFSAQKGAPGALFELLQPFAKAGINLTKLESRPSRRAAWDYNFYVDIDGHCEDAQIKPVLDEIRSRAALFRVLGSYPQAVI